MEKKKEQGLLWISGAWELVYAIGLAIYLGSAGATLWAGIPSVLAAPQLVFITAGAICTILGTGMGRQRLLVVGCGCCWAAMVAFPPLHIFLVVPALLTSGLLLTRPHAVAVG